MRCFILSRRNRQQTDFSLFMDSTKSVKVSKEGVGLSQVWRQQIQEFKNVSADMANAIMAEYPSPCALWQVRVFKLYIHTAI